MNLMRLRHVARQNDKCGLIETFPDILKHPMAEIKDVLPPSSLIEYPRSCVIRGPRGFGLSALGRQMALEFFNESSTGEIFLVCEIALMENHRSGVLKYVADRAKALAVGKSQIKAVILDGWINCSNNNRIIRYIREEYVDIPIILLQGFEDFLDIQNSELTNEANGFEPIYLRSLSRSPIRELVKGHLGESNCSLMRISLRTS